MRRVVLLTLMIATALPSSAQNRVLHANQPAPLEVMVGYTADRTNSAPGSCGCFWMQGAKAEASMYFGRGLSLVADLAGVHTSNANASGQNLSLVSYLFGPRYTVRRWGRWMPFAYFLAGGVHGFDANFPNASGQNINPDAFAFAAGGGLNVVLARHVALRMADADYVQTELPNTGSNQQDHLRVAAGIVFRF